MGSRRFEKMGAREGFAGLIDRLRYHEASRQGLGFMLVLVCAFCTVPGESRVIAGLSLPPWGRPGGFMPRV